jgi:hypothetical protein
MFKSAKTHWVWTPLTESLHPDRKAGKPVFEPFKKTIPRSWHEKGYVVDSEEYDTPGQ